MPAFLVRRSSIVLLLACVCLLPVARAEARAAAGDPSSPQAQPPARLPASKAGPVRVLFIGNSYTYFNNLPELVQGLAAGMTPARRIEFARVLVGGATLMSHWKQGDALKALHGSRWDYVFLQEQSTLGTTVIDGVPTISDPNRYFWPYVREFDREIKKAGAKTVLLATWARRDQPRNFDAVTHAYMTIGRELHALVVPAGTAWQRALQAQPDLALYNNDGSHPAPAGSYLAALTVLSALFDAEPPARLPLRVEGHATNDEGQATEKVETIAEIDPAAFALFRRVAWSTWNDVKQAGGYLTVTPAKSPVVAPLGEGLAIAPGALAGTWRGTLRLFWLAPGAPPQTIALTLTPRGASGAGAGNGAGNGNGNGYTGTIGPANGDAARQQPIGDLVVEGRRLTFSVPSGQPGASPIRYTAVLSAPDQLTGLAEFSNAEMAQIISGSWSAKRN